MLVFFTSLVLISAVSCGRGVRSAEQDQGIGNVENNEGTYFGMKDEGTYFGLSEDLLDNTFAAKEEGEGTYFGRNEEMDELRSVRG